MNERRAGILLPIFSLPTKGGVGTLGKEAYGFVDFLKSSNVKIWQVLPLLLTGYGDSPYQSVAYNALNYYFIDYELLKIEGLLEEDEYETTYPVNESRVDYGALFETKRAILKRAFSRFDTDNESFQAFLKEGKYHDFSVFMALKELHGFAPFSSWGEDGVYEKERIERFEKTHTDEVLFWQFVQFEFLKQWKNLKAYANKKGVLLMGDMPIYLSKDSVEMWKYGKDLFLLDENGKMKMQAGVPPDAFSSDGQLWGNPVYDWEKQRQSDYGFFKRRFEDAFTLYDIVRIDHFRGFDRFYAIPEGDLTARNGRWLDGPKEELFKGYEDKKIVAEDLGLIDDGVRRLMQNTGYPGMKVMSFGFDGNEWNEHKPSNFPRRTVGYTGTHDNAPLLSLVQSRTGEEKKRFIAEIKNECKKLGVHYLGSTDKLIVKTLVRLLFFSNADTVILPMQDVLGLGEEARINAPSTCSEKNWTFRFSKETNFSKESAWLKQLSERSGRA